VLAGIRPALRGEVGIEVNFDISADGIVSVSARDMVTGQCQSITVTATSGLTEEELKRIMDENVDELLARKQMVSDFERRREATERIIGEIEALMPVVTAALARSRFGKDAVNKAQAMVQRAQAAIRAQDGDQLGTLEEQLDRTLQLFKGLSGGAPEERGP
jgi:molecular chaperone DnaK